MNNRPLSPSSDRRNVFIGIAIIGLVFFIICFVSFISNSLSQMLCCNIIVNFAYTLLS